MPRFALPLLLTALLLAGGPARASGMEPDPGLHARHRVAGLEQRVFSAEHWWALTTPLLGSDRGFAVATIGRSAQGRELRHVRWGNGPVQVLLWSQMHGDESTATMALADLVAWLGHPEPDSRRDTLGQALTLHLVPLLNPDGAAAFTRRNAQGIDINRDAAALASPEAQALKALRDRIGADYGFNLHDQRPGYRAGDSDKGTAIALLAPPADAQASPTPARLRAIGVAARMAEVLDGPLHGHLARWDDTFNPRAFGDLMQQWGTSTVLIEAGGIEGDAQKQQLRAHVFSAIVTGLHTIADGSWAQADADRYLGLPENGKVWPDLLIRGATIAQPGIAPVQADVLVDFEHALSGQDGRIVDIGDLRQVRARQVIDADGLYLLPLAEAHVGTEQPARFRLARDAEGRQAVWQIDRDLDPAQPLPAAVR